MKYIMVDIESNGPVPGIDMYSMIELGAIVVEPALNRSFFGQLQPISPRYIQSALDSIGSTHELTLKYPTAEETMKRFSDWVESIADSPLTFISDNNGFDWQFVNYYCHKFIGKNPFGFSSQNLSSLTKGLEKDLRSSRHKKLRQTAHTHNALDDAKGNAEAFLILAKEYGLQIP